MHKFRSNTIVDFIENAVEYSRSGRYLFFLHRRPAHGPMRVQLLHPVSRFKHIQSLKHLCRSVGRCPGSGQLGGGASMWCVVPTCLQLLVFAVRSYALVLFCPRPQRF